MEAPIVLSPKTLIAITLILACGTAVAEKDKGDGKSVKDTASSVANEIGKGFEAIGKAVGPAVNKAEKAVRGKKDDGDQRAAERK